MRYYILFILAFILLSGCVTTDNIPSSNRTEVIQLPVPSSTTAVILPEAVVTPPWKAENIEEPGVKIPEASHNSSEAREVDYRKYVDWFKNHNNNIRAYSPEEYVCGQYTADMINDSKKAGYTAYFAAVKFSDGTGHALVSFKSTVLGTTSWYFFEPQTNYQMTPETLAWELGQGLGKTVTEVDIYSYFDDAGDKDPASWRFGDILYRKIYVK
ncbi:Uncharacterised protein [uncultured archaeon]|nr:Uncharacterised protein [uncultured archaeon]